LARALLLHGRRSEAQAEARRIATATTDGPTGYVALLLAGAIDEREARLQAARDSYQRAIDRYPKGQHAYVALAEVLTRLGDTVAAREVLQRRLSSLASSGEPVVEPWWYFASVYAGDPDSLPALRDEARR
jgi:predicted Zn-dependent protease